MTESKARTAVTLLDESQCDHVRVVPEDRDQFFITAQQAVEACRAAADSVRFGDQFKDLLDKLATWMKARRQEILKATVVVRDNDLLLLVVQSDAEFNSDFSMALAELDIEIANDSQFDLIKLNVLAIPPVSEDAETAFISSRNSWLYAPQ